ncbi:MAG: tetratricopeptide repeat protein [Desulfohalobiaceae bacterium]|nr:tetratricopeptide repeat protein [Desulfohalobiaceae bacterium]
MNGNYVIISRNWLVLLLLSILLVIIYSNTFHASWQLDDGPNITQNPKIKLTTINWENIKGTFHARYDNGTYSSDSFYRPLACLSFALNWYFHQDKVEGYHVVNLFIHILTAFVLFLTIKSLFETQKLQASSKQEAIFVAVLSATLWSIHPIQTSAVTYIVQRMALLAAFFYLLGIYAYIKGRLTESYYKSFIYYIFCLFFYFLALSSKQNAAMLPVSILLIEILFFYRKNHFLSPKKIVTGALCSIIIIVLLYIIFFRDSNFLFFLEGYERRGFSILGRVLTEPRIIVFHLSQIFYPVASRFSITHDIDISDSLLSPWTTIGSILLIISLIILAFRYSKKKPFLSLGILFFFLNHLIESTILPLELVFEHRNYLPSFFLFVPLVQGAYFGLDYYRQRKKTMYFVLACGLCLLIIVVGFGSYTRNMSWRTPETLWQDAMEKAPYSARPRHNLGTYYSRIGNHKKAFTLQKSALGLQDPNPKSSDALSWNNMGSIRIAQGKYKEAILFLKTALSLQPNNTKTLYRLALAYLHTDQIDKAEKQIDKAIQVKAAPKYLNMRSLISLKKDRIKDAEKYCLQVQEQDSKNLKMMFYLGKIAMGQDDFKKAHFFLNRAHHLKPKDLSITFALLENYILAGQQENTKKVIKTVLSDFSLIAINNQLNYLKNYPMLPPMDFELIQKAIIEEVEELSNSLSDNFSRK